MAVATAVVTVVALAVVEAQDRRWTRRPPQLAAVVVLALLVGAFVATVALQADRRLDGDPAVLAPGAVQPTIKPPRILADPAVAPSPTSSDTRRRLSRPPRRRQPPTAAVEAVRQPRRRPSRPTHAVVQAVRHAVVNQTVGCAKADSSTPPPPSGEAAVSLRTIWLAVASVMVLLLGGVGLRILWVALAWRRLRRRLRRGSGREQVAGAWVWSTRRLRAAGWPMPPSLSADAVGAGQGDRRTAASRPLFPAAGGAIHRRRGVRPADRGPRLQHCVGSGRRGRPCCRHAPCALPSVWASPSARYPQSRPALRRPRRQQLRRTARESSARAHRAAARTGASPSPGTAMRPSTPPWAPRCAPPRATSPRASDGGGRGPTLRSSR